MASIALCIFGVVIHTKLDNDNVIEFVSVM